jgi:hypothetical protein
MEDSIDFLAVDDRIGIDEGPNGRDLSVDETEFVHEGDKIRLCARRRLLNMKGWLCRRSSCSFPRGSRCRAGRMRLRHASLQPRLRSSTDLAIRGPLAAPLRSTAISCGVYGFPLLDAASIAAREIARARDAGTQLQAISLVAFDQQMFDVLEDAVRSVSLRRGL